MKISSQAVSSMTTKHSALLIVLILSLSCITLMRESISLWGLIFQAQSSYNDNIHGNEGHKETQEPNEICSPKNFLVLVKGGSKSKYQQRRTIWRNTTCPETYKQSNMVYKFMLAMPFHEIIDPNSHNQAKRASNAEIEDMEKIEEEAQMEQDIEFLPLEDVYENSNLKVISMLRWAVDRGMTSGTSVVIVHDDEFCLYPEVMSRICLKALQSNTSFYAGLRGLLWRTPGYEQQKAFDGSFTPYFGGWLYALSSDLVRDIAYDPKTLFTSTNLGYAEDLQVGRWVQNQGERNINPRKIEIIEDDLGGNVLEKDE